MLPLFRDAASDLPIKLRPFIRFCMNVRSENIYFIDHNDFIINLITL